MYSLPQEIEVWYIIPAIRREMAKCLIKEFGLTYEKVGKILGISKAAISQYLKSKRAAKVKLHSKAMSKVTASCKRLFKSTTDSNTEIISILNFIRENELPCQICDTHVEGVFKDCKEIPFQHVSSKKFK